MVVANTDTTDLFVSITIFFLTTYLTIGETGFERLK